MSCRRRGWPIAAILVFNCEQAGYHNASLEVSELAAAHGRRPGGAWNLCCRDLRPVHHGLAVQTPGLIRLALHCSLQQQLTQLNRTIVVANALRSLHRLPDSWCPPVITA